jgi:hypothetical protein
VEHDTWSAERGPWTLAFHRQIADKSGAVRVGCDPMIHPVNHAGIKAALLLRNRFSMHRGIFTRWCDLDLGEK